MLGFETHGSGVSCLGFLFGAAAGFACRLVFSRYARQGGCFGDLLGANFLVRQIGRASFGFGPLTSQAGEFFFLPGAGRRRDCQFRSGEFAALGVCQGTLFGLDSRTQSDFGQSLDMRLLRGGGLRRCLGGSATECVFRSKIFGLLAPLRGGSVLRGQQLTRFGGGASALFRTGAGQGIRLGGSLCVRRVCSGSRTTCGAFLALALHIHQPHQGFAQAFAPGSGQNVKLPIVTA
jgi:hypothetical protein